MRMVCLFALMSAVAGGAEGTLTLAPTPLEVPRRIGPLTLSGEPYKYDDPRLGVSYQFVGSGLSLTVYVYDAGITDLTDGGDTVPACQEFEMAKQGVMQSYQKAQLGREQLVQLNPPDAAPLMREAQYEYEREGHASDSFVWITVVAKNFVKLRFSMDKRLHDELPEARRAVLSAFGTAIKPHLGAKDSNAEQTGTSMGLNLSGRDDSEMTSAILYLGILSALVDKSPEMAPGCGGEVVPSYQTELGLYRGLIEMHKEGATTGFGKRLMEVDQAGMLEEFVWVELHRKDWGSAPPEGLTLTEYGAWRKKHLKRFTAPNFGSVVVDHPRPLPIEPLPREGAN